ncbi:hypothetical protein [Bradyrhizobium yuanmingense]|uniref:hypothetical protein n=1 Tax=Bradyrhizobium yuanmingense TaxID=108015 RepID=UPI0023B8FF89|nr:hypothetical protein [Bradyrhizobium yuanmingense]MDF0496565.1 hypothetical protein [Bradyrhizobium yuanmingense]
MPSADSVQLTEYGSIPYAFFADAGSRLRVGRELASASASPFRFSQRHSATEPEEMMLAGNIAEFSLPLEAVR